MVGKTIKQVKLSHEESSDNLYITTLEFQFTDGSLQSIQFRPRLNVQSQFFGSEADGTEDPEYTLVKGEETP